MNFFANSPSAVDGLLQLALVFGAAMLVVVLLALVRKHLVQARMRAMQTWAATNGYTFHATSDETDWLRSTTLQERLLDPRICNLCTHRSTHVADIEYLQPQVAGSDAAGATVVALEVRTMQLPDVRLMPDQWDPLDGPEPIRTGMVSDPASGERGRFDDRAGDARRAGMRTCTDLAPPYLVTETCAITFQPDLVAALRAAGDLRFEGSGRWMVAISDRRVAIDQLEDLIRRAKDVVAAVRRQC